MEYMEVGHSGGDRDHHASYGRISTAPQRSPGELFVFSQIAKNNPRQRTGRGSEASVDTRFLDDRFLDEAPRIPLPYHLGARCLDQAAAFQEQVVNKQSQRQLRIAQFERKKLAIQQEVDSNHMAFAEKMEAEEKRQLQFQRQLTSANQSKAFTAQQQRNEQQKLRRELDQQKAAQRLRKVDHKEARVAMFVDDPESEAEDADRLDICKTIQTSHEERNKELEHARQFVRNNERLNDAYWRKLLPEGRMETKPGQVSNRMARGFKVKPKSFGDGFTKGGKLVGCYSMRPSGKTVGPDARMDEESEVAYDPWQTFWSNWNMVHSRARLMKEEQDEEAWGRRSRVHHKLEQAITKKQEVLDSKSHNVRCDSEHRKARALSKKNSINAIHQAAWEETQQRMHAAAEKMHKKLEQKIIDQEYFRKERAALGKEAKIAAEKIAYANEHEQKCRQIEKEQRSADNVQKKLVDQKERAGLTAIRHQTKQDCALERKNAAMISFQFHARTGFEKNEAKHAHAQRSRATSADTISSGQRSPHNKRKKEPASSELLALLGASAAASAGRLSSASAGRLSCTEKEKGLADTVREELSKHLRVVGMTLRNVWKIMDLNGNGLVSMSEFQSGLKDVSWDPVLCKLGSPRACFLALGGGAAQLTPPMFIGDGADSCFLPQGIAPDRSKHHKGSKDGATEASDQISPDDSPRRTGHRGAISETPYLRPEELSDDEDHDEGLGDDDPGQAPWTNTEEDFVRAVESSLRPRVTKGCLTEDDGLPSLPCSADPK